MSYNKRQMQAAYRSAFLYYLYRVLRALEPGTEIQENWHIRAIVHQLERCFSGENNRLLLTVPPRSLKTNIASVAAPAFILGNDPTARIILASYSNDLSSHNLERIRSLLEEKWHQELFPNLRIKSSTKNEIRTTQHGSIYASSVGGTLTGRGAGWLIIDDPHKAGDAYSSKSLETANNWFKGTALSRLDNRKTGRIILVQQRLHVNDIAGFVIETGKWEHLNLPLIATKNETFDIGFGEVHHRKVNDLLHPGRIDLDSLEELQSTMSSFEFSAQYQQDPVAIKGGIFPTDKFKTYDRLPQRMTESMIVQSWDCASGETQSHDYSVCTTWLCQKGNAYLMDVVRERFSFTELCATAMRKAHQGNANAVLIEQCNIGRAVTSQLRNVGVSNLVPRNSIANKIHRVMTGSPPIESGQIFIPKEETYIADFINECAAFPNGGHDDQVDSTSQFLNWFIERDYLKSEAQNFMDLLDLRIQQERCPPAPRTKEEHYWQIFNNATHTGGHFPWKDGLKKLS